MGRTGLSVQQALEEIKKIFDLLPFEKRQNGKSFYCPNGEDNCDLFFDKRQYERVEVIKKLAEFFNDKFIEGGGCVIESITFLWTIVHIRKFNQ